MTYALTRFLVFLLSLTHVAAGELWLENEKIRLGVDLERGGAITWLSAANGENLVNNFDNGRQIQLSYFSGPVPFEAAGQKPAEHWKHIGWNPIQAGDDFHHGSKVVKHEASAKSIYVKCIPLQWPLNHVEGECSIESWLELEGSVVKVRARLNNTRADKTQYRARLQELPALYANALFHRVVSYTGAAPFTDTPWELIPKATGAHPWSFWLATEQWAALVDDKDFGLGLITPGRIHFTGGFAGVPGANDTRATHTGYLASQGTEILDHNIVHECRFEVVVGTLAEIRSRAKAQRPMTLPRWDFATDRQGWHHQNASDGGWPVRGFWEVDLSQGDPQLISPYTFWNAKDAPGLKIEAAFQTRAKTARLFWQRHGAKSPSAEDQMDIPIRGDGVMREYAVRIDKKSYLGGIVRLRIDPAPGDEPGAWVKLKRVDPTAPLPANE